MKLSPRDHNGSRGATGRDHQSFVLVCLDGRRTLEGTRWGRRNLGWGAR